MKIRGIVCLVFFFIGLPLTQSQEICDNSLDDDGDGLIDLLDDECNCSFTNRHIPNFSFEDTVCCPALFSQMECVSNWVQASDATSDFYHSCDFIAYYDVAPIPVFPLPDGNGFTGFLDMRTLSVDGTEEVYKEYIGLCLSAPLRKDTLYRIELFVGFGDDENTENITSTTGTIALFGYPDCSGLPFTGSHCPLVSGAAGWEELVAVPIEGRKEWNKISATFTAPFDIETIILGPDCSLVPIGEDTYFFIDRVMLDNARLDFPFLDLVVTDAPCNEALQLSVSSEPEHNYQYQWYRNGIAIQGATGDILEINRREENFASYRVVITNSMGDCVQSRAYTYIGNELPIADLGEDTVICNSATLSIGSLNNGLFYHWSTGETTQEIIVNNPGIYQVTVVNDCGTAIDDIEIMVSDHCQVEIPNVFTPNNDGINDHFGVFSNCVFESYHLQVFNRLGQVVFETFDPSRGWDGKAKNTAQASDVYIWTLQYSLPIFNDCPQNVRKMSGDLTLIR